MNVKRLPYLVVLSGPTASGKSALAIELARIFDSEIISADSRQIYRKLNIGTAKVTKEEMKGIPHHMIDILDPDAQFTALDFAKKSKAILSKTFENKKVMFCAGGTAFYLKALTEGFDDIPDVPREIRDQLASELSSQGIDYFQDKLKKADPDYANQIDLNNPHRLIRALSVIEHTGMPFSSFLGREKIKLPYHIIQLTIEKDRLILYDKINDRVDQMLEQGLETEVLGLRDYWTFQALNTVGYREWFPYFEGTRSREEVVSLIKRNSRRYAKRQLTWFRNQEGWENVTPTMESILSRLKAHGLAP